MTEQVAGGQIALPEGTVVLDFTGERETQTLTPQKSPQLLIYPNGRMARVWRNEDGAVVMVSGDSPKALLNAAVFRHLGEVQDSSRGLSEATPPEGEKILHHPERVAEDNGLRGTLLAPLQGASPFATLSGGIASLNPRLLSDNPPGCCTSWLRDIFIAGRVEYIGEGTPAAQRAMAVLHGEGVRWLRGEIGQFVMGVRHDENGIWLAGVTLTPRVWTLRLQDILPEGFYRLTLWRDALPVDNQTGEVEEMFEGVTRNDKPAIEMPANGGFVARLEPCHETEFRMLKGERE